MCVCLDQVAHLYEWEQEAHGEVSQPVHGPGDHEGSRSVGLFEQLPGQDEGDTTWQRQDTLLPTHLPPWPMTNGVTSAIWQNFEE